MKLILFGIDIIIGREFNFFLGGDLNSLSIYINFASLFIENNI